MATRMMTSVSAASAKPMYSCERLNMNMGTLRRVSMGNRGATLCAVDRFRLVYAAARIDPEPAKRDVSCCRTAHSKTSIKRWTLG